MNSRNSIIVNSRNSIIVTLITGVFLIIVWFFFPYFVNCLLLNVIKVNEYKSFDLNKMGTFGDTYGALNTLISSFAFISVLYTIFLQNQELKKLETQFSKQSFDDKFSTLLEQHEKIRDNITIIGLGQSHESKGYDAIRNIINALKQNKSQLSNESNVISTLNSIKAFQESSIIDYFKSLEFLIDHLKKNKPENIKDEDLTKIPLDILKGKLTNSELILICSYCLETNKNELKDKIKNNLIEIKNIDFLDDLKNLESIFSNHYS